MLSCYIYVVINTVIFKSICTLKIIEVKFVIPSTNCVGGFPLMQSVIFTAGLYIRRGSGSLKFNLKSGHSKHTWCDDWPTCGWYVPLGHRIGCTLPKGQ